MSGKATVVFALLAVLLVSSAASSSSSSSSSSSPVEAEETNILQQLTARREEAARDPVIRQKPRIHGARAARRAHLSDNEREIMTKQIAHAISEMMNSECMSDRDYQGWVDFGRRDAD